VEGEELCLSKQTKEDINSQVEEGYIRAYLEQKKSGPKGLEGKVYVSIEPEECKECGGRRVYVNMAGEK
jgi:hypothetical protein